MPTYEYKCKNCKHEFDVYQSMKDDKLTKCPNCGKDELTRLIGRGSGLIFKGSGFYLTDYKNKDQETSPEKSDKKTEKKDTESKQPELKNSTETETPKSNTKSSDNKPAETKPDS